MGNFLSLVLHESNTRMHLIIAVSTKRHVTIATFHFCYELTPVALPLSTLPVAPDDGIYLRTLNDSLLAWLDGAAALASKFLIDSFLTGRADQGFAAAGQQGGHLVCVAELA